MIKEGIMSNLPQKPGIHEQHLPPEGRRYAISIPDTFDGKHDMPLVLALHWGGPIAPFTSRWLLEGLIEPALRDLNAVLIAPDRTLEDWANPQSEAETLELLDFIKQNYSIDSRRTLLTGYSLGGIGTWYIGARNQNLFAAALPISAAALDETVEIDWTIPIYVIHSRLDEIFPLQPVEKIVGALKSRGVDIELQIVEDVTHFQVDRFVDALRNTVSWIRNAWSYEQ
jgi:predicted peptidase